MLNLKSKFMNKYMLRTGKAMLIGSIILLTGGIMQAQHGYGKQSARYVRHDSGFHAPGIPNLTDEQQKKIETLKLSHQKEMTGYRNDMAIREAELRKYRSADKPDMVLINKTIDEIGRLYTEMQKKRVSHEMAVRNLLTDEQKIAFDAHRTFRGYHQGRGMRNGGGLPHGGCMQHDVKGYSM
jgi:Spy/CpxP family protein refolding chaperone